MIDSTASRILALRAARSISSRLPHFDSFALAHSDIRPSHCAALGAGSEPVVLVFEQDVGCMICISAPPAALDRYPRGVAGHVAHPIRSIQISDF